jgi:hypothetical protein
LLNWTVDNAVPMNAAPPESPKPKRSGLPVLVVLFLFAWGLMASLIMEQGRTIDSQRWLIQSLFQDSTKLSQMKMQAIQKRQAEAQAQAAAKAHSQAQTPSTQDNSKQNQAAQDPAKQSQAKNRNTGKLGKPAPHKPPTDADTPADERRIVMSI